MTHSSFDSRLARVQSALEGLSIGDAFGTHFFAHAQVVKRMIITRL